MIKIDSYYVYEYYIKDSGEVFYVGKGKDRRVYSGKRNKFCEDMKASHNWDYRIVYSNLTEQMAFEFERELIKWYKNNTDFRLTNQTDGGEGVSGWIPTEEFRKKQSAIAKSRWNDETYREKIIKERNRIDSIYQSKMFKNKISQLVKGEKNPNFNHRWSDEQKMHLSKVRKANGKSKGILNNKAKSIQCVETGEIFPLIKYAMKKYGVKNESSFSVALDNPKRTAAKLHWVTISPKITTVPNISDDI